MSLSESLEPIRTAAGMNAAALALVAQQAREQRAIINTWPHSAIKVSVIESLNRLIEGYDEAAEFAQQTKAQMETLGAAADDPLPPMPPIPPGGPHWSQAEW